MFACKADICTVIRLKCLLSTLHHANSVLSQVYKDRSSLLLVQNQSVTEEIKSEKSLNLSCPTMKLFTQDETDTYTNYIIYSCPTAFILKTYWAADICQGHTFTIPMLCRNISAKQINHADL